MDMRVWCICVWMRRREVEKMRFEGERLRWKKVEKKGNRMEQAGE